MSRKFERFWLHIQSGGLLKEVVPCTLFWWVFVTPGRVFYLASIQSYTQVWNGNIRFHATGLPENRKPGYMAQLKISGVLMFSGGVERKGGIK